MAAPSQAGYMFKQLVIFTLTTCSLIFSPLSSSQTPSTENKLTALTQERESLSNELAQYQKTMGILGAEETDPTKSNNPAVRNLAVEMAKIKARLIQTIEQEVAELQAQISNAEAIAATVETPPNKEMESRPLRTLDPDSSTASIAREADSVARLLTLLTRHNSELQESAAAQANSEELAAQRAEQGDAYTLAHIPYSVDKIRLSGSEGSTALAQITQRLNDASIPESRRDVARIFSIRTRLSGSLISSENRSLKPVGKHHYVAKVRLNPGNTSVQVGTNHWEIQLPEDIGSAYYLVTLYTPPTGKPEFHIFPVADLLAQENPYIPAWLPTELQLTTAAG
jgi:hypothetical protein